MDNPAQPKTPTLSVAAVIKGYNIPPATINYGQHGFGLNGTAARMEASNNGLGVIKL